MIGKALGEFVLIQPEKVEEKKTKGGLILPSGSKNSNKGKVVSLSKKIESPGFKEGDTVLFSAYSKDVVIMDDVEYLIMPVKDVKMVIK